MKKYWRIPAVILILAAALVLGQTLLVYPANAACTQALVSSAKQEFLSGTHVTTGTPDTFKLAFYADAATYGAATTAYSATNEVSGGGYTAGGFAVTPTPGLSGTTGLLDFADIAPTGVTFGAASTCAVLYNSSKTNKAIAVFTFTSVQPSAGTLTVDFPASGASTSAVRIAELLRGGSSMVASLLSPAEAYADEPFILGVTRRDVMVRIGSVEK
jgi:hypothetical protein